jgi:hypothetical protein
LELPDPLFKEVKTLAVQRGVSLKKLLTTIIETGLHAAQTQAHASTLPRRPHPLPVAWERISDEPLRPALSNEELQAILDEEDLQEYLRVNTPTPAAK